MPRWIKFTDAYDHPGDTIETLIAYPAGATLYVANEIADAADDAGVAKPAEKPEGGDDAAAAAPDDGRSAGLAEPDGDDAHRGDVRVEFRDAVARKRPD